VARYIFYNYHIQVGTTGKIKYSYTFFYLMDFQIATTFELFKVAPC